ncbi:MAG: histidinol-phosphate transaminase [Bdellovibrionaceae bacterium]|jgi:histidinol-phosphate aminotransferase|nr:histidinol-phosphate transaminase [Pseudobdellovibrionaceae bacterium]
MEVTKSIQKLIPYQAGKPISEVQREYGLDKVIKLASNENPLGPSEKVKAAVQKAMEDLHRYPDPSCYELTRSVTKYFKKQDVNIETNQLVFGNGSDELIGLVIRCYSQPGDEIIVSESSFIAYSIQAKAANVSVKAVPLREDLKIDLDAIYNVWEEDPEKYKLIFIPNPNNPTGCYSTKDEVDAFLHKMGKQTSTLVVFDEAYFEFARAKDYPNALAYLQQSKQVVVLKTFSKVFGVAGLRVGVMVADPEITGYVHRIRAPFNVNSLGQAGVMAALEDDDYLRRSQEVNWSGLDYFYTEFKRLGIKYWPSEANFVLFETGEDSMIMFEALLQKGIILRPIKGYGLPTQLRISVGLPEENQEAIKQIELVYKGEK